MLLPHVSSAYNNAVNATKGFAPNEIHIDRLPRLSLSVFEPDHIGGHKSLNRDRLVYIKFAADRQRCAYFVARINLATDRQRHAYFIVRKLHRVEVSRLQRRNTPIVATLFSSSPFAVGGWISPSPFAKVSGRTSRQRF